MIGAVEKLLRRCLARELHARFDVDLDGARCRAHGRASCARLPFAATFSRALASAPRAHARLEQVRGPSRASPLRPQHHLDATVLFLAERLVEIGSLRERPLVRDDEARVDLAVLNEL